MLYGLFGAVSILFALFLVAVVDIFLGLPFIALGIFLACEGDRQSG